MKGDLEIIGCGYCAVPDEWYVNMTHRDNRLYYIHSGNGWYEQGDKKIPFQAGMLYFIPYTVDATLRSDPDDKMVHTWCDFRLSLPIFSKNILSLDPNTDDMAGAALSVFHAGSREHISRLDGKPSKEYMELYLQSVRYLVDRTAKNAAVSQIKDAALLRAIEEMHDHISEKISMRELADECFLSEDGFIRRFTKKTGVTPYAYFKELRIRTAILLRAEGHTLDEIASRTGYADASSLIHAIKKYKA